MVMTVDNRSYPIPMGGRFGAPNEGGTGGTTTTDYPYAKATTGAGVVGNPPAEDDVGLVQIPASQVHPVLRDSPHPAQAETQSFVVNGKTVTLTNAQVAERIQKELAGDEKLRDAASETKKNAVAIALHDDLMSAINDDDVDALRRAGAALKIPGDQVEKIIQGMDDDSEDGLNSDDEDVVEAFETDKRAARSRGPVTYEQLSPDLQRALRKVERGRIEEIVKKGLDSDEVIRYNMERMSDKLRAQVTKLVDDKVRGRIADNEGDFGDGSEILREVMPDIRQLIEALPNPERTHGALNFGPSPGGGGSDVYPTKPPDHVPSTEGDRYEQSIMEQLNFNHQQAERGRQG